MRYVDGFVIPIKKKNLRAYARIARAAGKIWREHGAVAYVECVGEDLKQKFGLPFPRLCKLKPGETALFSWIVFKSRTQRDRANAKVMKDPRMDTLMKDTGPLFDIKRMTYGGFDAIVDM